MSPNVSLSFYVGCEASDDQKYAPIFSFRERLLRASLHAVLPHEFPAAEHTFSLPQPHLHPYLNVRSPPLDSTLAPTFPIPTLALVLAALCDMVAQGRCCVWVERNKNLFARSGRGFNFFFFELRSKGKFL